MGRRRRMENALAFTLDGGEKVCSACLLNLANGTGFAELFLMQVNRNSTSVVGCSDICELCGEPYGGKKASEAAEKLIGLLTGTAG